MSESGVGENIKRLRVQYEMTQDQLGVKLGIGRKHVSKLENGVISPSKPLMHKICDVFGVDEMEVRFGKREEPKKEAPTVPEHLKELFEEIAKIFPSSYSLIDKSEKISRVMRDLREGEPKP